MIPAAVRRSAFTRKPLSFRTDRTRGRPARIAHSREIHLEEPDRRLAGHDPVADLSPDTILDDRGVADRHRPSGDLPYEPIGRGCEHEIADVALRIRVKRVGASAWVV